MPTGSPTRCRGFTYLLLLFGLALGSIGLAALGEQARTRVLREQEAELAFRGAEIARAIAGYVDAGPVGSRALPRGVEDLLEDRRSGRVVRHLRQWRADPLGGGDWVWLGPGEGGCSGAQATPARAVGLSAVRSASPRLLLKRTANAPKSACDLVFRHEPYRQAAAKTTAVQPALE